MGRKSKIDLLKEDFDQLRDPIIGEKRILNSLKKEEKNINKYLSPIYNLSGMDEDVYPSQGMLFTPYDYLDYESVQMLPKNTIVKTLRLRRYFLELFNHPYRISFLKETEKKGFTPPPKVKANMFDKALESDLSLSIGDIGIQVTGADKPRSSRSVRYAQGPFVKLGKQARSIFMGSASPDVWNSSLAVATMAASHSLVTTPRNGVLSDIKRQADLLSESFVILENLAEKMLKDRVDRDFVLNHWKNNVGAAIEANPKKVLQRTQALYNAGVRTFRIYSPEPGTGPIDTLKLIRKEYKDSVEIFVGQIVDVVQAKLAEEHGADGIVIGIGGGGRCITGVRSGSVIDWPILLWQLRGEINIPIITEGGASDNVATTLLLGSSGISVSRVVAGGTIESPSGALFCVDKKGKMFKPYGGEASARTKYLDGKLLPFEIPSFVEGETRKAEIGYLRHALPTLTYNLHLLTEDAILAMVFRNVESLSQLHSLDPSPLRQNTSSGAFQQSTH